DGDHDGLSNALEYTLGGSVSQSDSARLPRVGVASFTVGTVTSNYATVTFTRRTGTEDVTYTVETNPSLNPATWTGDGAFVNAPSNGDGTETVLYRAPNPQTTSPLYLRVKTQINP